MGIYNLFMRIFMKNLSRAFSIVATTVRTQSQPRFINLVPFPLAASCGIISIYFAAADVWQYTTLLNPENP